MSQPGSGAARPLPPLVALVLTLLGIGAMFLGGFAGAVLRLRLPAQVALGTVLLALPAIIALSAERPALRTALGQAPTSRMLALSASLGAALWVASIGLIELQSLLLPPSQDYIESMRALHHALAPANAADFLVSLTVIALLPGLCEELVVRGVLLPSFAARIPGAEAVVFSAALFAAMHWDLYRSLFTFAIGLVFGQLWLRTRSLWPCVAAHATLNALTFLLAPYLDDPTSTYTPHAALGLACLALGSAVALPLWRRLGRQTKWRGL